MFRNSFLGQGGFDELRKHVKTGNEFCKEVGAVLQERAEAEVAFAKKLTILSGKLTKATNVCFGSLAEAWGLAGTEMEAQADMHRQYALSLLDEISKPLKNLAELQHKTRKPVEVAVERAHKALQERRADEVKVKKLAFSTAKEREKVCDSVLYSRSSKGKALSEKDMAKMEKKVKTFEEIHSKTDLEYLEQCRRAESCRQDWESTIYKSSSQLQTLEEERINLMQDSLNRYNKHLSQIPPQLTKSCDKLGESILAINSTSDLKQVIAQKGTAPTAPEQILPDLFAEERQNSMDKERRKTSLGSYIVNVEQNLEKELKGREGVKKLMDVYVNKPSYGDLEAQAETQQRLNHVNHTISYLEAMHYKFSCGLAELEGNPLPQSPFSSYIERTKDKQGMYTSILKVPIEMTPSDRLPGDGGIETPYESLTATNNNVPVRIRPASTISTGSLRQAPRPPSLSKAPPSGRPGRPAHQPGNRETFYPFDDDEFEDNLQARAIYDYAEQHHDELTMQEGDIVSVYDQQADGWWRVELNGRKGLVPATYLELV